MGPKMVSSLLRGATVGAAVAVTIGLASSLAACASATTNANGSPVGAVGTAGGTVSGTAPTPPASAPASSPAPGAPTSVNPGGPIRTAPVTAVPPPASAPAQAPLSTRPGNSNYVPIDQETQSADGRTLYLEIEARGGACGQYVVVLQEATSDVHVGLAQLQPKVGVMCPMYIAPRTFPVKLSAPVGTRAVSDLATGRRLGS